MFYHLLEIIVTNASMIKNWLRMKSGQKRVSQTQFRDNLNKEIITTFGKPVIPNDMIASPSVTEAGHSQIMQSVLIAIPTTPQGSALTALISLHSAKFMRGIAILFGTVQRI